MVRPETSKSLSRLSRLEPYKFLLFALLVPFFAANSRLFAKFVSRLFC